MTRSPCENISRLKSGLSGDHRLRGVEMRTLQRLRREGQKAGALYSPPSEVAHSHSLRLACSSLKSYLKTATEAAMGIPGGKQGGSASACLLLFRWPKTLALRTQEIRSLAKDEWFEG